MTYKTKGAALVACMLAIGVASTPQSAFAQQTCMSIPPPQQTAQLRPIPLGISGGNNRSIIKDKDGEVKGCFSGTLGSMVQDSANNQYILSNNHVLANQNLAKPGQPIVQPGLADVQCVRSPTNAVATFSSAVKLRFGGPQNSVDAAIAAVTPGQVTPQILFIGNIAGSVDDTPVIGMAVEKMGRTTCFTTGVIAQLNANLSVNYSETKKPKLAKFVNQIVVTGKKGNFGGPGDSGSLIVTQDSCPRAVALLFAGSADGSLTFANPIPAVLSKLGVSMVGSCTAALASDTANADSLAANVGMSADVVASATAVRDRHEDQLMSIPGAVGSGIAAGDQSGQAAIVVYVKKLTSATQASTPKDVEGTPVKVIESGEIIAY
jgi:hypothetical protein